MARQDTGARGAGIGAGRVWEAVLCRDAVGFDVERLPASAASEAAFWGGSDRDAGASVIENPAKTQVLADVSRFARLGARRRERRSWPEAEEQGATVPDDSNARGQDTATAKGGARRRRRHGHVAAPPGAATPDDGGTSSQQSPAGTPVPTRPARPPPSAAPDERFTERSRHLRRAVRQRRTREMQAYVHQLADKSREFARNDVFLADTNRARIEARATVAFGRELSERRVAARVQSDVRRALHPGTGQPQTAIAESTATASGLLRRVRARHRAEETLRSLAGRARKRAGKQAVADGRAVCTDGAVGSDAGDGPVRPVPLLRLPGATTPAGTPSSGPPSRGQDPGVRLSPHMERASARGLRPRPPTSARRPRTTRPSPRDGGEAHPLMRSAREVHFGTPSRNSQRGADASPEGRGAAKEGALVDRAQRIVGSTHGAGTAEGRPRSHVERLSDTLEQEQNVTSARRARFVSSGPGRRPPLLHDPARAPVPAPPASTVRHRGLPPPSDAGPRATPGLGGWRGEEAVSDDAKVGKLWEAALRVKGELTEALTKISDNDLPLRMYPPLLHLPTYFGGAPELEGLAEPGDAADEGEGRNGQEPGEGGEGSSTPSHSLGAAPRGDRASTDLAHGARHVATEAVKRLDGLLPPALVRELSRRVHRLGRRTPRRSSSIHALPSMGQAHLIAQLTRARERTSDALSPRARRVSSLHRQSWSERAAAESPMLAQAAARRSGAEGPSQGDPFGDLAMVEEEGSVASSEGEGGDATPEGEETVSVTPDHDGSGGSDASLLALSGSLQGTWSLVTDTGELLSSCPVTNPTRGLLSVGSPRSRADPPGSPHSVLSALSFAEKATASSRAKGWIRVRNRLLRSEALGAIRRRDPDDSGPGTERDSETALRLNRLLSDVGRAFALPQPAVLAADRLADSDSESAASGVTSDSVAPRVSRVPKRASSFESRAEGSASAVAGAGAEHLDGPLFALPAQLLVDGRRVAALQLQPHIAPQRAALHELRGEDVLQLIQPVWAERAQPPLPPVLESALRRCVERERATARRGGGEGGKEPHALLDTAVGGVSVRTLLLRATLHGRPVLSRRRREQVGGGKASPGAVAAAWGEPVDVPVRGSGQQRPSPGVVRTRVAVEEAKAVESACGAAFRDAWVQGVRSRARDPADAMDFLPASAAAVEAVVAVKAARAEGRDGADPPPGPVHRGGGAAAGRTGPGPTVDRSPHRLVASGDPRRWEWLSLHRVRVALVEQQRQWDGGLSQPQSTGSQWPRPLPPGFAEVLEEAWDALETPLTRRVEFILRYGCPDARHLLLAATRATLEVASAWKAYVSACQDMQGLRAGIIRRASTAALPRFEERLVKAFETSQHEARVAAAAEQLAIACVQASQEAGFVPSIGSASVASHLLPLLHL